MSDVTDLVERAQFLCDRLDELEWHDGNLEDGLRDYMGHVDPAHARLKAALERLTRPADDVVEAQHELEREIERVTNDEPMDCVRLSLQSAAALRVCAALATIKQTNAVEAACQLAEDAIASAVRGTDSGHERDELIARLAAIRGAK